MNMNESAARPVPAAARTTRHAAPQPAAMTLRSYLLRSAWLATEVSDVVDGAHCEGVVAC